MPRILVTDNEVSQAVTALRSAGLEDLASQLEDEHRAILSGERESLIERAQDLYASGSDDNIEVDPDAQVSVSENGTWVAGWLYVPDAETENNNGE